MHTQSNDVQALKNPAPRNSIFENVARTMSVDEIVGIYETITAGTAPLSVAYEWGFKALALASEKVGRINLSALDHMLAPAARDALDDIKSGRDYLQVIAPAFEKYPEISAAIHHHLSVLFYAEATLIPFYMLSNKTVCDQGISAVCTYILKHPLTGLIKIGRTADVQGRIKSLQTGAGAILSTLAIIHEDVERELHQRFSELRRHGEWFEDVNGAISSFAAEQEVSA
ncbi:hypothetical protein AO286_19120 [Pseudomonas syringae]|uniref:GIY-YIG nuclease family protein n=1 Tax=Pseudomonas syringae group TaxID=136849 RepID=UPI000C08B174|nr:MULTISPECIES: GIY-YIG nuclease family protein [Pseudomonas syringae group]PHN54795.1 hypothetical protein AO286_19120 [Pseudomonas syringae]RMR16384.1 hypothetical protein ALP89_03410 [Pseudomonas syringae pv. persicae]